MSNTTVKIDDQLSLVPIGLADHAALQALMAEIYPPAYASFWKDGGDWYLEKIYGRANFESNMADANALFYFVNLEGSRIGIMRILEEEEIPEKAGQRATKLQRLYLSDRIQGQGVGKRLMNWLIDRQRSLGYQLLWLDVMEHQQQALGFYQHFGFQLAKYSKLNYAPMYDELRGIFEAWGSL